ncbi:hypothetical protein [Streptomyces sp. NPDC059708]|uniref:hypothetical protein n=1 Tax=Streptomyces sp. NPDC059708 TaxID=3346916 RepID=UPI0036C89C2D
MKGFVAVLAFLVTFVVVGFVGIAMGAGAADATDFPQDHPGTAVAESATPRPAPVPKAVVEHQEQRPEPVVTPTPKPEIKPKAKQPVKPEPKTTTRTECKQLGETLSCIVYVQRVAQ